MDRIDEYRQIAIEFLEEGLATYFAHQFVENTFNFVMQPTIQSYETARQLVNELLSFDIDAIKKIRQNQFTISKITSKHILDIIPEFNLEKAQILEQAFVR